eukprot:302348-Rhodomonas_salina.1
MVYAVKITEIHPLPLPPSLPSFLPPSLPRSLPLTTGRRPTRRARWSGPSAKRCLYPPISALRDVRC